MNKELLKSLKNDAKTDNRTHFCRSTKFMTSITLNSKKQGEDIYFILTDDLKSVAFKLLTK